jgi:hypothetical protein
MAAAARMARTDMTWIDVSNDIGRRCAVRFMEQIRTITDLFLQAAPVLWDPRD